jgi:cytochrome c-type biogenesis protein CcmF
VFFSIDYFETDVKAYNNGDIVAFDDMLFSAKTNHSASVEFAYDMDEHWNYLPFPTKTQAAKAERWINGTPGEFLFTLDPSIQLNERMGNSPEPDTRHSLTSDLYSHIKWARLTPPETDDEGWLGGKETEFMVGDSMFIGSVLLSLDSMTVVRDEDRPERGLLERDIAIVACFNLEGAENGGAINTKASPLYIVRDNLIIPDIHEVEGWGLKFRIDNFNPTDEKLKLTIWEHESVRTDFIVIQAIIFPLINILWLGCILMAIGSFMAVRSRLRKNRLSND